MKPFNLQKALAGEPVVTRSGKKVTQLTHFKHADPTAYPLYGVIESLTLNYWTLEGKRYRSYDLSNDDLFMAPTKQTAVVEIWRVDNTLWSRIIPVADKSIGCTEHGRTLVHIQQIEWEE